jgi:hypothetical protein
MENNMTPDVRTQRYLEKLETFDVEGGGEQQAEPDPAVGVVAQELGQVLTSYVDLLDNDNHGGWSMQDEERVRAAVTMLNRAGRGIHRRSILKSKPANEAPGVSTESSAPVAARRLRVVRTTRPARESSEQTRWDTDGGANWELNSDS